MSQDREARTVSVFINRGRCSWWGLVGLGMWGIGGSFDWVGETVGRVRGVQGKPCSTRNQQGGCGRINIVLVVNFGISHLLLLPTTTRQGGDRLLQ
jgi:hypothetical protein